MPNVRCPYCRSRFYISEGKIVLTERQRTILDAIPDICQKTDNGLAPSASIAAAVGWSQRTVQSELSHLMHIGEVVRPGGRCSGWAIPERLVLILEEPLSLSA